MFIINLSRYKSVRFLANKKQFNHVINKLFHRDKTYIHNYVHVFGNYLQNKNGQLLARNFSINTGARRHFSSSSDKNKKEGDNQSNFSRFVMIQALGFAVALLWVVLNKNDDTKGREQVSWDYFIANILTTGEVKKIVIDTKLSHGIYVVMHTGAVINGRRASVLYVDNIPDISKVSQMIRHEESRLQIDPMDRIKIQESNTLSAISVVLLLAATIAGIIFVTRKFSGSMKNMTNSFESLNKMMMGSNTSAVSKKTGVKFADIAGMEEAKLEVMEFVHFLKNPEKYEKLGGKMPKGCLLTGPPGVGKTLLAKALAAETDVPFFSKSGSDFVEMIGGLGAKRVRDMFEKARSNSPCIIYIDEVDAVGGKRNEGGKQGGGGSGEYAQTLNQILVEMDGMLSGGYEVIVMASTNRPDMLDPALLRPGRFDRHIYIDLPTLTERRQIFEIHLSNLKLKYEANVYSDKLARLTPGMSGADIANVCNEAAIFAAREQDKCVDEIHFQHAIERIIAGSKKMFSPLGPEDKMIVSMHESGHAIVGWMLEHTDVLMKVSIVPHTKTALGYSQMETLDRKLLYQQQLFERMCVALGGRAAESLYFDRVTSGAEDDIKKVTDMAYAYVKHFGFSSKIGHLSFQQQDGNTYVKPYSNYLQSVMDQEAQKLVYQAYNRAKEILEKHKDKLLLLGKNLSEREVLQYDDIEALIGPPVYGDKRKIATVAFGPFASEIEKEIL